MEIQIVKKTTKIATNGVDVPKLLGTIAAVRAQPDPANFTFRDSADWLSDTHCRLSFNGCGCAVGIIGG
ncbi:hypothetical protein [Roseobacter sp.]|uniref:hypothetical protein n=1 Tax=Roseobacter sp. TaxID=1907202 RepID=UPI00385E4659